MTFRTAVFSNARRPHLTLRIALAIREIRPFEYLKIRVFGGLQISWSVVNVTAPDCHESKTNS